MGSTSDLRVGAMIKYNGETCVIMEHKHVTPGKGHAHHQAKLRNLKTGKQMEARFGSNDKVELVRVEKREYTYLYSDGGLLYFMSTEDFEQIPVDIEVFGDELRFLKENQAIQLAFEDTEVLGAELPASVELLVTHTEPGVRGDTATNVLKPATVETGAEIQVPLFINEDEVIIVNTGSGEYMGRAKD